MKKLLSTIVLAAVLLTSLTACQKENKPLESNWKFEQLQTKDKTTKAEEFSEEDTPVLQIIKDNLNEGEYFITYRQSGKNHAGIISKENDTYSIMFNDTEEEMRELTDWISGLTDKDGNVIGNKIPLHISRFFPRYKMTDRKATDVSKIYSLADIAGEKLEYVYTGNC